MNPVWFRTLHLIGKGRFGRVCAIEKIDSREYYAMKVVAKGTEGFHALKNECEILESLDHTFIVTLWTILEDDYKICPIYELIPGGHLRHRLWNHSYVPEDLVIKYTCEMAIALDFLEMKRIIHRDIKPENILLDAKGHTRLTDFKCAIKLGEREEATALCGTKPYIAPEVFESGLNGGPAYSYPADWWSLGVTMFELLCGEKPYKISHCTSDEEILEVIVTQKLEFPKRVKKEIADLITQILTVDVSSRLSSLDQLQEHPLMLHMDFIRMHEEELDMRRKYSSEFETYF